jgi:acetolactate synthase-1/3 small subunit
VVDMTNESIVFELTGAPSKLASFIGLMEALGLVEVCRTGVAALRRGPDGI